MSAVHRERHMDSDAGDLSVDVDLGEMARRRDREKAARAPAAPEAPDRAGGGAHRDLDAEARPRELDVSASPMPRRRRPLGPM